MPDDPKTATKEPEHGPTPSQEENDKIATGEMHIDEKTSHKPPSPPPGRSAPAPEPARRS